MLLRLRKRAKHFEDAAIPEMGVIYRVARQLSDESRAADLVQETYLRAWKYFESFEQGTNCKAWLLRILHNVWADQWRQSRLELPLTSDVEAGIQPYYDWEVEFLKNEFSQDVKRAILELPEMYRWAVLLVDVEELSYQEVARVMNCPIGTVMSRINRGRRTLARLLSAGDESRIAEVDSGTHVTEQEK